MHQTDMGAKFVFNRTERFPAHHADKIIWKVI